MIRKMFDRFLMLTAILIAGALAIAGPLSGCSDISAALQSPTKTIEASCTAVGVSVQTLALAEQNGKLDADTEKSVDSLIAITAPVCTASAPPTLSSAEQTVFINAASQLATVAAKYGSN